MARKTENITKFKSNDAASSRIVKYRLSYGTKFIIVIMLLWLAVMIFHIVGNYHESLTLQRDMSTQTDEIETLTTENDSLDKEVSQLKNDEYVLKIARKKYFFSEPNELIFQLPDAEDTSTNKE